MSRTLWSYLISSLTLELLHVNKFGYIFNCFMSSELLPITNWTYWYFPALLELGLCCWTPLSTILHLHTWLSVLLMEENGGARENHWPHANHWQTLSHSVVSSTPRHEQSTILYFNCEVYETPFSLITSSSKNTSKTTTVVSISNLATTNMFLVYSNI